MATYSVVRYSASGVDGEGSEAVVSSGLTLDEAKRQADKGHGGWKPQEPGEVVAYHESADEGCGGYVVREDA